MRPQDKPIFSAAAAEFSVWILVRRTNPDSLKYAGLPGYAPKPIDCKPKTADCNQSRYATAGLVVDASIWPNAFVSAEKREKARKLWDSFYRETIAGENRATGDPQLIARGQSYSVDTDRNSKHYGCLMLGGCYLFGDYDLYDIIPTEHPRGNLAAVEVLHGSPHRRGARVIPVQNYINQRIGIPMVQHGGQAQYADHSEEPVDVFGPSGEEFTILNRHSLRAWYDNQFQGRKTLS